MASFITLDAVAVQRSYFTIGLLGNCPYSSHIVSRSGLLPKNRFSNLRLRPTIGTEIPLLNLNMGFTPQ